MLHLVYVIIGTALLFLLTEILFKTKKLSNELIRKFLHISLGVYVSLWPFFLSWPAIYILVAIFIVGIAIARLSTRLSKKITIFGTIRKLDRPSHGDVYFCIGVGLTSLLTHDKYIFMASILTLSLSDGLAALLGKKYGSTTTIRVFGAKKSLVGSLVFLITTMLIMVLYYASSGVHVNTSTLIILPLFATFVESLSDKGVDNLIIPITILFGLKLF